MVPVEPRAYAAVVVDGAAAHGAGRAAGADDGGRVGGKRLHLTEARLEGTGGRLIAFVDEFDQRDLEGLLLLPVRQRHEADPPPGRPRLPPTHVGQPARPW